jgi:hypothetical protein
VKSCISALAFFLSALSTSIALAVQDTNLTLEKPVLTNNQVQLTLHCDRAFQYFIESSTNLQNWARAATNYQRRDTRIITLPASGDTTFYRAVRGVLLCVQPGISAAGDISFSGNHVYIDAYDSSDGVHFPGGEYNAANAFARGDIGSAGGTIDIGNAEVHGWVILGYSARFSIGASGLVGDMPTNWPAQSGVQGPEWLVPSEGSPFHDVFAPYSSGTPPPAGTGTNTYNLVTGNYFVDGDFTLNNHETLFVDGRATLYITGSLNAKTGSSIVLEPWATLTLYVGSATGSPVSATFNQISNRGPSNALQLHGLPTCESVTLNCTPSFKGFVYAPAAAFTLNGGGACATDFQGACVVNSMSISGRLSFHFDRNLYRPCLTTP